MITEPEHVLTSIATATGQERDVVEQIVSVSARRSTTSWLLAPSS